MQSQSIPNSKSRDQFSREELEFKSTSHNPVRRFLKQPSGEETKEKPKFENDWYLKEILTKEKMQVILGEIKKMYNNIPPESLKAIEKKFYADAVKNALLEVVAQELFRLLMPAHPKTRLVLSEEEVWVASKGIRNFHGLHPEELTKIKTGEYKGLGKAQIIALLVHEMDFKLGNVGVDADNNVIKIDGDWCFPEFKSNQEFGEKLKLSKITEKTIFQLPFLDCNVYFVDNWLDIIKGGKPTPLTVLTPLISQLTHFREEVNEGILSILLLPNILIGEFIKSYVSDYTLAGSLTSYLCSRKENLLAAAVSNESFKSYIVSEKIHNF